MALIDDKRDEEQLQDEAPLVADLPVINATDQAHKTLDNSSSVIDTTSTDTTNRFPGPKIRGESTHKSMGATSRIDLSIPANEKEMWDKYNTWWRMPKGEERNAIRMTWYETYYGMTYDS